MISTTNLLARIFITISICLFMTSNSAKAVSPSLSLLDYRNGNPIISGSFIELGKVFDVQNGSTIDIGVVNHGNGTSTISSALFANVNGFSLEFVDGINFNGATTLAAFGGNGYLAIKYTPDPSVNGIVATKLTLINDDANNNPYILNFTGSSDFQGSSAEPEISIVDLYNNGTELASNSIFDFGVVTNSNGATSDLLILNQGNASLDISSFSFIEVNGFSLVSSDISTNGSTSLGAFGGNGVVAIKYTPDPSVNGDVYARLVFANNDSDENPYVINVSGQSIYQGSSAEPEITAKNLSDNGAELADGSFTDLGTVVSTNGEVFDILILNQGDAMLDISSFFFNVVNGFSLVSSDISTNGSTSLAAFGGNGTIAVRFTPDPTVNGNVSTTLTLNSNDSDEGNYQIHLSAKSVFNNSSAEPEITAKNLNDNGSEMASGSVTSLGVVTSSNGKVINISILNQGDAILDISSFFFNPVNGFSLVSSDISTNGATSLAALGGNGTIAVRYTPNPAINGIVGTTLTLNSNDSDESNYHIHLIARSDTDSGNSGNDGSDDNSDDDSFIPPGDDDNNDDPAEDLDELKSNIDDIQDQSKEIKSNLDAVAECLADSENCSDEELISSLNESKESIKESVESLDNVLEDLKNLVQNGEMTRAEFREAKKEVRKAKLLNKVAAKRTNRLSNFLDRAQDRPNNARLQRKIARYMRKVQKITDRAARLIDSNEFLN